MSYRNGVPQGGQSPNPSNQRLPHVQQPTNQMAYGAQYAAPVGYNINLAGGPHSPQGAPMVGYGYSAAGQGGFAQSQGMLPAVGLPPKAKSFETPTLFNLVTVTHSHTPLFSPPSLPFHSVCAAGCPALPGARASSGADPPGRPCRAGPGSPVSAPAPCHAPGCPASPATDRRCPDRRSPSSPAAPGATPGLRSPQPHWCLSFQPIPLSVRTTPEHVAQLCPPAGTRPSTATTTATAAAPPSPTTTTAATATSSAATATSSAATATGSRRAELTQSIQRKASRLCLL